MKCLEFKELPSGTLQYTTTRGSTIVVYQKPNSLYDWFVSDNQPRAPWSNPDPKNVLNIEDLNGFWDTSSALDSVMSSLFETTGYYYEWRIANGK